MNRCVRCPAKQGAVCTRKSGKFDLAVVLDYPTNLEARRGKLLEGDTGKLVKTVLQALGIEDGTYYVTSALNCRPANRKRETVLRKYMEGCRPRLLDELQRTGAKKVLCMGPIGYSALTDLPKIAQTSKHRGRWVTANGMNIILTYSPTVVLIDPQYFRDLAYDVSKFIETDSSEPYPEITTWIPQSVEEVRDAFTVLDTFDYVSADFETSGFSPIDDQPLCLGYCGIDSENRGFAVIIDEFLLDESEVWELIGRQLANDQPTVFHNAKFDLKWMKKWLEKHGLKYNPWNVHCTAMLSYLLDERTGKYAIRALESIARFRYDAPDYGIEMGKWLKKIKACLDEQEIVDEYFRMYKYCGFDCYYTARMFPEMLAEAEEESERFMDVYYDILMPGSIALAEVELQGIRVDANQLLDLRKDLTEKANNCLEKIKNYIWNFRPKAADDFNPGSPDQMYWFLYRVLRLPVYSTPRKGKLKEGPTSAAVLRIIRDKHPEHAEFCGDILEWRTLTKAIGTYCDGILKRLSSDGRLRGNFRIDGTETGRLSSNNPNMQNIQEVSRHNIDVRGCFKPIDDNWILMEADYSQLELRVAAHLSEDKDWLQVYLEDRDLHQDVAGALYERPKEEITTYQRWLAKNTVFGAMYGRGAESLALGPEMDYVEKVYGGKRWTLQEAKEYFENFFNRYKGFKSWIDEQHRTAYKQHYVETSFGRRRRFPFISRNDNGLIKRQSVNTPIQGTASDITLTALVRIHHRLKALNKKYGKDVAHVVLTIHDSVVVECRKIVRKQVAEIMREEMEQRIPLKSKVPFKVDIHSGVSWTALKA